MKKILISLILTILIFANIVSAASTTYEIEMDNSHGFYRVFDATSKGVHFYVPFKDVKNKTLNINKNDTIIWENAVDFRITIISEQNLWNKTNASLAWSYKRFNYTFTKNGTYTFYIKEYPRFRQAINVGTISLEKTNSTKSNSTNLTKSNVTTKLNSTESNSTNLTKSNLTNSIVKSNATKSNVTNNTRSNNSNATNTSTKSGNSPNKMYEAGVFMVVTGLITTTIYRFRKKR